MFPDADKDCSLPLKDDNDMLLCYHPFSDGFDDGGPASSLPPDQYMERLYRCGSETLRDIANSPGQQHPVTCLIYTLFLPCAAGVARELCLPSVLFWIQPASLFVVYYHYFHDHRAAIDDLRQNLTETVDVNEHAHPADGAPGADGGCRLSHAADLPGLPRLEARDMPSFLVSTRPASSCEEIDGDGGSRNSDAGNFTSEDWNQTFLNEISRMFQILEEELPATGKKPKVLVNTFDELERDAIAAVAGVVDLLPVGLLVPPSFADLKAGTGAASDLFKHDNMADYMGWLGRWPSRSVVYISFGSFSVMDKAQTDEFMKALGAMGRPYLWMVRKDAPVKPDEAALGERGKLVAWCNQIEVLRHNSVGCFVTHCGWNSTTEAMAAGVPMIAVPQWTDQPMNARLIDGVWRCGVRADSKPATTVRAEDLKRCVGLVMGDDDEGAAIRRAAAAWSDMATAAVTEGGSSDKNLRLLVDSLGMEI